MGPAIETSPQAHTGCCSEIEVAVERQFDGVGSGDDRRFFEPNAMLYAAQMQHGVPAILSLSELAFAHTAEIQLDTCIRADEQCRANRHNRRRGLGSPEDRLLEKGSLRVGCERPTPNADGIRRPWLGLVMRSSGNLARTLRSGVSIPTPCRSSPLSLSDGSKCRRAISS